MTVSRREFAVTAACAAAFLVFPGSRHYPGALLVSFVPRAVLAGLVAGLAATGGMRAAITCAAAGAVLGGLALVPLLAGEPPWLWLVAGVTTAMGAAASSRWARAQASRPLAAALALAAVTGCHVWTLGLAGGPYAASLQERERVYARPVEPERYAFDGEIYLRTEALMKQGAPFYAAFQRAWREDSRFDGSIPSAWSFREPALFYLWRILPGSTGVALLGWFTVFTVLAAIAGWFLAATFVDDGIALLAPIAMLSYFAFFVLASLSWFSFAEVWAAGAVVLALALLLRRRWLASAFALVAAVAIRELAFLFVPAWVVAWGLSRGQRGRAIGLGVAVVGSLTPLIAHMLMAPASHGAGSLATWLHSTGLPRLLRALRHGTEFIPYGAPVGPLAAVAALGGALALLERRERWTLATALILPLTFMTCVSAGAYDYYWGAILVPLLLATTPLALARVLPAAARAGITPSPGGAGAPR
jgi:hypothetical protein